jgi:glyoxylase-like metal-dependent hydrolase (beta-lactamase superfamily II)
MGVSTMSVFQVGDVTISRVGEVYGPLFPADVLMPAWDPAVRDDHGPDTIARFIDASDMAVASVHTWVLRTPQKTILVDTCNGNHKQRNMEDLSMMDTDWLDRLIASGVQPDEVDAVVCTHLHLDHVGWNTMLVGDEWVPTFPNARYFINRTEFEFWNPAISDQTGLEFNAYVFDDSVQPVFDRDLVELWEGNDCQVDDTVHLEVQAGHTPGHSVGWVESNGEWALLSGDSMHSAVQVYRPDWNSAFCGDGDAAAAVRRGLLEACVEHDALLLPAHFSAPHAFRVRENGNTFSAIDAA